MGNNLGVLNNVARSLDTRALNLILLPTEQCNFRCTYCYEDFKQGAMPASVVSGIKNLLAARVPDLDELVIGWFGGEPLLAARLIYDLSHFILRLQRAHPALQYRGGISTNGHLLDVDRLSKLVACGVTDYQITLDGPSDMHDQTRVMKNGQGSFERIWRNLLAIRDSDFDVQVLLRVHFQADSYLRLFPLIELLNREFADDSRFWYHFKAVARLGGPNDAMIRPVPECDQGGVEETLRSMLRVPSRAVIMDDYVCYAGAANSLVIRSNGDVNKCTVALNDDINRIGRLNADGSMTIDQDKFRRWVDAVLSGDRQRMACPYRYILDGVRPLAETAA